ncbi:MAG: SMI1/KNR4 family protein [Gammaproteobacteria bacterium]|nr:SMI1/KNR4 family protein [Gammaproteobacteria bacterium]
MSELPANFSALLDEARENGLEPPCPPDRLQELQDRVQQAFTYDLPPGYLKLLSLLNGFNDFGLMIFADTSTYSEASGNSILGFLEANEEYRQQFPQRIAFAQMGDDLLAYDLASESYINQDREPGGINERYTSFEEMLDVTAAMLLE